MSSTHPLTMHDSKHVFREDILSTNCNEYTFHKIVQKRICREVESFIQPFVYAPVHRWMQ